MTQDREGVLRYEVQVEADLAVLVTQARRFLREHFDREPESARILTAMMELARNAVRYADGGTVQLRVQAESVRSYLVTLRVEDRGPGIVDIESAMQDAYSTGRSLGLGLPGVRRLMDRFTIDSEPGGGTRVVAERQVRLPS